MIAKKGNYEEAGIPILIVVLPIKPTKLKARDTQALNSISANDPMLFSEVWFKYFTTCLQNCIYTLNESELF